MIQSIRDARFGEVLQPGVVPKFDSDGAEGGIAWAGPDVGAHNEEIYAGLLGFDAEELAALQKEGIL